MKYFISLLVFTGGLLMPGFAQEAVPAATLDLDLAAAVKMAIDHSYSLKQSAVDFEMAKTLWQTSWSSFYPTASLSASLQANDTAAKLGAGMSLGLGLGVSRVFEIQAAGNAYDTAQANLEQAQAQLESQVKKNYWGLVLYAQQLEMLESQKDAEAKRFETVQAKYDLRLVSEIDMLQAEFEYKSRLVEYQTAQNTYNTNMLQFTQALGIDRRTRVRLTDGLPDTIAISASLKATKPESVESNPDLKLLGLSYQAAEIARGKSISGFYPTISLGMSLSWAFAGDPFQDPLFNAPDWSASPGFSVSVSVPLDVWLPFSETQTGIMKQDAALRKIAYSIQDKQDSVRRQAETLMLDLAQIETQIDSLAVNVTLAQKNLMLVEQLYDNGRKSLLEVKDARNSMTTASVKLVQARLSWLSDVLDLEYLLGADLGI